MRVRKGERRTRRGGEAYFEPAREHTLVANRRNDSRDKKGRPSRKDGLPTTTQQTKGDRRDQSFTPPRAACIALKKTSVLSITPVKSDAPRPYAETGMSEAVWTAEEPGTWPVTR